MKFWNIVTLTATEFVNDKLINCSMGLFIKIGGNSLYKG